VPRNIRYPVNKFQYFRGKRARARARVYDCVYRCKLGVQEEGKIPLQFIVYLKNNFLAIELKRGKLVIEIFSKLLFRWCKKMKKEHAFYWARN
jgi:hypothetical protein